MSMENAPAEPAAAADADRPAASVHTSAKRRLGALVSARSSRRGARIPERPRRGAAA